MAGLVLAFVAFTIHRERVQSAREWQARQAAQDAQVAARGSLLAGGDLGQVLVLCRGLWRDELNLHHEPAALAWTRRGLDGYFLEGSDRSSLRQVSCTANGVSRGPRVVHPLHDLLPAEAPPDRDPGADEDWQLALHRLSSRSFGPEELAVELLRHPLTGAALSRRWRAAEGGARATLEPADAPPFAMLVAAPGFPLAAGAAPPTLRSVPRYRWLAQADTAFAVVQEALPAGAGIVELSLGDDEIEVSINWPTPAFDGDPPAPYGDKTFDEYGVAEMDWWYPRTIPGFGCPTGQPLARVRAGFDAAKARLGGQPLARAWYSCSTAYSDGHTGVWHLLAK